MIKYTQKELEAMSDFELSSIIAPKQGCSIHKEQWFDLGDRDESVVLVGDSFGNPTGAVDYCNNPADIMPLAIEAGLALIPQDGEWVALSDFVVEWGECDAEEEVRCAKPYRALAIVWILVNQEES